MGSGECLECGAILELVQAESTSRTHVFRCGDCGQSFMERHGEELRHYRRGPFVGPMYALIYEEDPAGKAEEMADRMIGGDDTDGLEFLLKSCEAELRDPSQRLSEVYEFQFSPSEESLREFLRILADRLREGLQGGAG